MRFFRKIKILILILLIPAISWVIINAAINLHSHLVNGYVITHAHPFFKDVKNKSPYQSHKHTAFAFFILDQISNPVFLISLFLIISFSKIILKTKINTETSYFVLKRIYSSKLLRAPPSF